MKLWELMNEADIIGSDKFAQRKKDVDQEKRWKNARENPQSDNSGPFGGHKDVWDELTTKHQAFTQKHGRIPQGTDDIGFDFGDIQPSKPEHNEVAAIAEGLSERYVNRVLVKHNKYLNDFFNKHADRVERDHPDVDPDEDHEKWNNWANDWNDVVGELSEWIAATAAKEAVNDLKIQQFLKRTPIEHELLMQILAAEFMEKAMDAVTTEAFHPSKING